LPRRYAGGMPPFRSGFPALVELTPFFTAVALISSSDGSREFSRVRLSAFYENVLHGAKVDESV
ncbi:hypothetical protein K443DRAFT_685766, partial [Laccaria amethystina LaAM-08-1]